MLQILCQGSCIQVQDLGLGITTPEMIEDTGNKLDLRPMAEIEADVFEKRLAYFSGEASKAAESLGLSRSAFYRQWKILKNSLTE